MRRIIKSIVLSFADALAPRVSSLLLGEDAMGAGSVASLGLKGSVSHHSVTLLFFLVFSCARRRVVRGVANTGVWRIRGRREKNREHACYALYVIRYS